MDEVGRGTGTNDGLSIAWAVTEHLLESRVKTLFATHFHELTAIEHEAKVNLALEVLEKDDEVVFLKRIRPGAADHSYGIHVARLAGVPISVVDRARAILAMLLNSEIGRPTHTLMNNPDSPSTPVGSDKKAPQREQSGLFDEFELIRAEIQSMDIGGTTPLDALTTINRWQQLLNTK